MTSPTWLRVVDDGVVVTVRVTPGARRSEIVDRTGDVLRLKVAAPPVDGLANAEVARVVAELLGVRPARVSLRAGAQSRDKVLFAAGDGPSMVAHATR